MTQSGHIIQAINDFLQSWINAHRQDNDADEGMDDLIEPAMKHADPEALLDALKKIDRLNVLDMAMLATLVFEPDPRKYIAKAEADAQLIENNILFFSSRKKEYIPNAFCIEKARLHPDARALAEALDHVQKLEIFNAEFFNELVLAEAPLDYLKAYINQPMNYKYIIPSVQNGLFLAKEIPEAVRERPNTMYDFITESGDVSNIQYLPDKFKNKKHIMFILAKFMGVEALEYASEQLRSGPEFVSLLSYSFENVRIVRGKPDLKSKTDERNIQFICLDSPPSYQTMVELFKQLEKIFSTDAFLTVYYTSEHLEVGFRKMMQGLDVINYLSERLSNNPQSKKPLINSHSNLKVIKVRLLTDWIKNHLKNNDIHDDGRAGTIVDRARQYINPTRLLTALEEVNKSGRLDLNTLEGIISAPSLEEYMGKFRADVGYLNSELRAAQIDRTSVKNSMNNAPRTNLVKPMQIAKEIGISEREVFTGIVCTEEPKTHLIKDIFKHTHYICPASDTPLELLDDPNVTYDFIRRSGNWLNLQYATDRLRDNDLFMFIVTKTMGNNALKYASARLQSCPEFMMSLSSSLQSDNIVNICNINQQHWNSNEKPTASVFFYESSSFDANAALWTELTYAARQNISLTVVCGTNDLVSDANCILQGQNIIDYLSPDLRKNTQFMESWGYLPLIATDLLLGLVTNNVQNNNLSAEQMTAAVLYIKNEPEPCRLLASLIALCEKGIAMHNIAGILNPQIILQIITEKSYQKTIQEYMEDINYFQSTKRTLCLDDSFVEQSMRHQQRKILVETYQSAQKMAIFDGDLFNLLSLADSPKEYLVEYIHEHTNHMFAALKEKFITSANARDELRVPFDFALLFFTNYKHISDLPTTADTLKKESEFELCLSYLVRPNELQDVIARVKSCPQIAAFFKPKNKTDLCESYLGNNGLSFFIRQQKNSLSNPSEKTTSCLMMNNCNG